MGQVELDEVTTKTIRRLFAIHRVTGAIVAMNMLVLSLTGVVLVFHEEIDALVDGDVKASGAEPIRPLPEVVAAAHATRPTERPSFIFFEEGKPDLAHVGMAPPGVKDPEKTTVVSVDARTARVGKIRSPDVTGFTHFVYELHAKLLLGEAGKLAVGGLGLALLVSLVTGVLAYGPAIRRFWFGLLRRDGRRSLFFADVHKLIGASLAGWLVVVVTTGVLLALGTVALQVYQVTALAQMTAAYRGKPTPSELAPLAQVVTHAEEAYPGDELAFITFPGGDFSGEHHFGVFTRARAGLQRKLLKIALVDAETGVLTAADEMPWFLKAVFLSEPLHYGDYGGMPLKVLWALFGLASAGLSATGLYVFVSRRRGRRLGRPEIPSPIAGAQAQVDLTQARGSGLPIDEVAHAPLA